mmetsp:Transcript_67882/g.114036  ORF Transcript_67882/g.114036 Transcript_67882/m.114036 type:complete len:135 (+) Transcript_67882:280-684(+)|eukprot:CAMPEP_0174380882 /NCGR_PEP_ID=MMETSP0811_2-20130205/123652_1 /TAXON_ID=73025 ORGANISM="Eutreptiella gymnastica-like, Strain CCMP1594" /NCGR_SAMPLE_ID=MMETSP0811_2 /ASSEMBLY_ACC=CAM_ASM_000667 /LENGTH=134 /DNA_ID=CAMNT_0015533859 /DNA_START=1438 /DNA_END=1842 /DNA_ORIENTATION=-
MTAIQMTQQLSPALCAGQRADGWTTECGVMGASGMGAIAPTHNLHPPQRQPTSKHHQPKHSQGMWTDCSGTLHSESDRTGSGKHWEQKLVDTQHHTCSSAVKGRFAWRGQRCKTNKLVAGCALLAGPALHITGE